MKQSFEVRALNDAQAGVHDAVADFPFYRAHLAQLLDLLAPMPGGRYLDLGCGTGNLLVAAKERGAHLVGVDLSAAMLIEAWRKGCTLVMADLHALPFAAQSVDGVVSLNVLWQVDDQEGFIDEAWRVLRPGARLVLSTPRPDEQPIERRLAGAFMADIFRDPRLAQDYARLRDIRACGQINSEIASQRPQAFCDEARLGELLGAFEVEELEKGYADQNWVVVASRA